MKQLEHLVEGCGVAAAGRADREEPLEVAADELGFEQRFAGTHPVAVAADRVDLAVVRDVAVRVRERPRRERVRREAAVYQADRTGEAHVGEVGEHRTKLVGGQHALVDQRPRGQRREVQLDLGLAGAPLGDLARGEGQALER